MIIERITAAQASHQAQDLDLPIRRVDDRGRVFEHRPEGEVSRVIWEDNFEFVVPLAMRSSPATSDSRSAIMRAVKSKDTTPEMVVGRLVHGMGYRYRLHRRDLPGKPDLTFPAKRKVIFVNGCFWHGHLCARGARRPAQNAEYWKAKIGRNVERDVITTAGPPGFGLGGIDGLGM